MNGPFVALDVETGKIAWQYTAPQPLIGGALATAGNLVFMGEGNGWFDAFNAKTGDRVRVRPCESAAGIGIRVGISTTQRPPERRPTRRGQHSAAGCDQGNAHLRIRP